MNEECDLNKRDSKVTILGEESYSPPDRGYFSRRRQLLFLRRSTILCRKAPIKSRRLTQVHQRGLFISAGVSLSASEVAWGRRTTYGEKFPHHRLCQDHVNVSPFSLSKLTDFERSKAFEGLFSAAK